MTTKIVNLKNEVFDVYIGRKGKGQDGYFGNPYQMGHRCLRCKKPHPTPESTIPCFREYFIERVALDGDFRKKVLDLRDRTLGCFCKPKKCHGDVIVEWLEDWERNLGPIVAHFQSTPPGSVMLMSELMPKFGASFEEIQWAANDAGKEVIQLVYCLKREDGKKDWTDKLMSLAQSFQIDGQEIDGRNPANILCGFRRSISLDPTN